MTQQNAKRTRGCLFYLGIIAALMAVVILVTALIGARYARHLVERFTDAQPVSVPETRLSETQMRRLQDRIEAFGEAVTKRQPVPPLTLTEDEANALIASASNLVSFRGHFHVSFAGDQLRAQMSIPAEQLGLSPLRGRYVNATGTFTLLLRDGRLFVNAASLSTKGRAFPQNLLRAIRLQNLAGVLNSNVQINGVLTNLAAVEIKDGRLTLEPKNSR